MPEPHRDYTITPLLEACGWTYLWDNHATFYWGS